MMATKEGNVKELYAAPLPATITDLMAKRVIAHRPTLNDLVEEIFLRLYESPDFSKYVEAVWNSEAVEGNTDIDDTEAARIIRKHAIDEGIQMVAKQKLDAIIRSMRVVMRRYEVSRTERRNSVGGHKVGERPGRKAIETDGE